MTIRELMSTQVQCVLSTVAEGAPSQHLMAYALETTLTDVYIASRRSTRKIANMLDNPSVSLLWDNRTGNTLDHEQGLAQMAEAQASQMKGWSRARVEHLLLERNPELAGVLSAGDSAVIALRVRRFRLVQGYDAVTTFIPGGPAEFLQQGSAHTEWSQMRC